MTPHAAAVLNRLRTHGPHTYRQLEAALAIPITEVIDAVRALQEHRHIEPAGAGGWKTRTRGVDLDQRNADLVREQCGMFLDEVTT